MKTTAGMHRFSWDLHYDPTQGMPGGRGFGGGSAVVPHRTYPGSRGPWVPPGTYTVRLTADGQTLTQPITIKLDPRVKITPDVQQIFTLTARMEDLARKAASAYKDALSAIEQVKSRPQSVSGQRRTLLKKLEDTRAGLGRRTHRRRRRRVPWLRTSRAATSGNARESAGTTGRIGNGDAGHRNEPPTATELAAAHKQEAAYTSVMAKWAALKQSAHVK